MSTHDEPAPATSPRQAILGIFILLQLVFLIGYNGIQFIQWAPDRLKDKRGALMQKVAPGIDIKDRHAGSWSAEAETMLRRWSQLTGQDQGWALFTDVGKATNFPAVVLLWDEPTFGETIIKGTRFAYDPDNGYHLCAPWNPSARDMPLAMASPFTILGATSPWEALHLHAASKLGTLETPSRVEMLLSENEPEDVRDFLRVGKCRLRRYEGTFDMNLQPYRADGKEWKEDETPIALAERATRRVRSAVNDYHDPMLQYMKWRLRAWQEEHPGEESPKQVILFLRFYRIVPPQDDGSRRWEGPILWPIARWRPETRAKLGTWTLEPFDYIRQQFGEPR